MRGHGRLPALLLFLGLSLTLQTGSAQAQAQVLATGYGRGEGEVDMETVKTESAGLAELDIHSTPTGSKVSVNRVEVGYTPYSSASLAPGTYVIAVAAPGWYEREIILTFAEKTRYILRFALVRVTGVLSINANPEDADLILDGETSLSPGDTVIPAGDHVLVARRFGYVERKLNVHIAAKELREIAITLQPAPFSVGQLSLSRAAFNPANAGILGTEGIRFRVESYGAGRLDIHGPGGELVASRSFPSFATWQQGFEWSGRNEAGKPLPDGPYKVSLFAWPTEVGGAGGDAGEAPAGALVREAAVLIDSSLRIEPLAALGALPGLAFVPDPRTTPAGNGFAEVSWLSPANDLGRSGIAISLALGLPLGLRLGLSASAEGLATASSGGGLAASLGYRLWSGAPDTGTAGAILLRASMTSATASYLPTQAGSVEAMLPLSLSAGIISIGLSPALAVEFSGSATVSARIRGGLWLGDANFRAGISSLFGAAVSTGGLAPEWPLRVCAEGRLMLSPSPFVLGALGMVDLASGGAATWGGGISLGLEF